MKIEKNASEVAGSVLGMFALGLLLVYVVICTAGLSVSGIGDRLGYLLIAFLLVEVVAYVANRARFPRVAKMLSWIAGSMIPLSYSVAAFMGATGFFHIQWAIALLLAIPPVALRTVVTVNAIRAERRRQEDVMFEAHEASRSA